MVRFKVNVGSGVGVLASPAHFFLTLITDEMSQ